MTVLPDPVGAHTTIGMSVYITSSNTLDWTMLKQGNLLKTERNGLARIVKENETASFN